MLQAFYFIFLEAAVSGIMVNRTLWSKSVRMWHLPIFVVLNTAVCSFAVYLNLLEYVSLLCVANAFLYSLVCFSDSLTRKLAVSAAGVVCLFISEGVQAALLRIFTDAERIGLGGSDELASVICICMSLCVFCALTVIAANIFCKVRFRVVAMIVVVNFLQLLIFAVIYAFMHKLIDVQLNGLFTVYALVFLIPALIFLYFTESVIFLSKDSSVRGKRGYQH